ncbi:MAG: DUF84 family protein [bacterium]|nr:DUF84 family protein [bacterium]
MKVNVGSKNKTKIDAVTEVFKTSALFAGAVVEGIEVNVEQFGHPKTLKETVEGALNRSRKAFVDCQYSVGIEGGLMEVSYTKSSVMEVTACAIYDGKRFHLGLSPAFEWPKKVTELILGGMDGSQALKEAGFTNHPKIGTAEGGISILTHGRVNRKEYTKSAVQMALIHLENPEHF